MSVAFRIGTGADYEWIDYWDDQCLTYMEQFCPIVHREFHVEWIDKNGDLRKESFDKELKSGFQLAHNLAVQGSDPKWLLLSSATRWKLVETKSAAFLVIHDNELAVQIKLLDPFTMIQIDESEVHSEPKN